MGVFEDVPRLLGDAVVIERAVLEALGRVRIAAVTR